MFVPSNQWSFTSSMTSLLSTTNILINSSLIIKKININIFLRFYNRFLSIGRGSLFSIFLLCRIINIV